MKKRFKLPSSFQKKYETDGPENLSSCTANYFKNSFLWGMVLFYTFSPSFLTFHFVFKLEMSV